MSGPLICVTAVAVVLAVFACVMAAQAPKGAGADAQAPGTAGGTDPQAVPGALRPSTAPALKQEPVAGSGTVADPVHIPPAAGPMKIDGKLDDWATVGPMPMPFSKAKTSGVRFCWNKDGLYGSAVIKDATVKGAGSELYKGDCMEVFIEKDFARSPTLTRQSLQLAVGPAASGKDGQAALEIWGWNGPWGDLKAAWSKTADGYIVEFQIPIAMMGAARMAEGTRIGLNFVINDDGKIAGQAFSDKDDGGFQKPATWGAAILTR